MKKQEFPVILRQLNTDGEECWFWIGETGGVAIHIHEIKDPGAHIWSYDLAIFEGPKIVKDMLHMSYKNSKTVAAEEFFQALKVAWKYANDIKQKYEKLLATKLN